MSKSACFLLLLLFVLEQRSLKAQRFVVSNQIGMKFGSVVFQVNAHRLMGYDF